jgi:hypothetical protein
MVDFCESRSPFHVCLTIHPSAHLVYATSHLCFVAFYSYLVSWLAMIWACTYFTDFTDGWFLRELLPFHVCLTICPFAHLMYATSHLSFVAFYSYLVSWLAMIWACGILYRFHGWLIYFESYSPFHVCLTIRPFAHLVYATSYLSFVAFYSYLVSWLAMIWTCAYYTDFTDGWFLRES